jgi:hypothetical protein
MIFTFCAIKDSLSKDRAFRKAGCIWNKYPPRYSRESKRKTLVKGKPKAAIANYYFFPG